MAAPPSTQNAAMLKHYRMNDLFPVTWEDTSSSGQVNNAGSRPSSSSSIQRQGIVGRGHTRNTSRYSVLQEEEAVLRANRASKASNASRSSLGLESNLPQDEPDPLGMTDSVVKVLRANGNVEVDMNLRFRNRYLISSKSFSSNHFLRDVHQNSSTGDLQNGLEYLTTSITQKSSALKQLVSNNFDRFVLAKSTIDAVYEEMKGGTMRHVKTEEEDATGEPNEDRAMFKLVKDEEWGLKGTRSLLTDIGNKAGVVFGPMLENRGREEKLRMLMLNLERQKNVFEISSVVVDAIKRKDYEAVKEEYFRARKIVEAARALVYPGRPPTESELHRMVVAERMWAEVEEIMEEYKRDTWRRLVDTSQSENFLDLITMLLELGVKDNPIWVWLLSRYDYLKKKISTHFERLRVELEVLRRKVAAAPPPTSTAIAYHLRTPMRRNGTAYDGPLVTAFWELLVSSLSQFLSPTDGILGEVISFWGVAQNFIDGKTQKTLPLGPEDNSSEKHHRLSEDGISQLRKGGGELVSLIVKSITNFFSDPPVDDVSLLVSPVPPDSNANTPNSSKPTTPLIQTTFKRTNSNLGDKDAYAFMAPSCNSLSGTHFLSQVLGLLGTAAAEMHKLPIGKGATEGLRGMVNGARERAVHAMCTVWLKDSKDCKVLEDWTRASDNRDVTKMPGQFLAMEGAIILGMQDMLYVTKSKAEPSNQVILPPSKSLVTFVRQQFVKSLYMALNGMIENAKSKEAGDLEDVELASPVMQVAPVNLMSYSVDKGDANVRMLLTLSNLQVIRTQAVPQLMEQFEAAFGLKLTDESKSIKDALTQIDSQLFDAYSKPYAVSVSRIIRTGVLAPDWEPKQRADSIKPYVHEALLELVLVHAQVTTTAPSLTGRILSYLLECMSADLLGAFKGRPQERFGLNALLQATLDVEFVNQTLSQYGTPRARELQQDIYVELDHRSDAPARTALHKELSEMKTTLTALRRASRAEFLCFRQKKGSSSGASGGSGSKG